MGNGNISRSTEYVHDFSRDVPQVTEKIRDGSSHLPSSPCLILSRAEQVSGFDQTEQDRFPGGGSAIGRGCQGAQRMGISRTGCGCVCVRGRRLGRGGGGVCLVKEVSEGERCMPI